MLFPDQKQAVEGKATVLELGPDGNLSPAHLLPETHERINKGSLAVFVYGRVSYTDSFGASHWSQFCESGPSERIRPSLSGAVSDCLSYNAVDQ